MSLWRTGNSSTEPTEVTLPKPRFLINFPARYSIRTRRVRRSSAFIVYAKEPVLAFTVLLLASLHPYQPA